MPSGVTHTFFIHLGIILILVLGFYSGLSAGVRTVYLFSLCVVSLLSSRFTASALVWFYNFLKYLVFHFFISLSTVFICRSSWILWLFMYQGAFRMDRRVLD
jgi:thiamine transporter ThiT